MGKAKTAAGKLADKEHEASRKVLRHRDDPVVAAVGDASEIADQPPLIAISVATFAIGAVLRRPAVARAGARMLASHLLATGIKTMVKGAVDRTRPAEAVKSGHKVKKGEGTGRKEMNSFPSGHTAGAVAVARAAARDGQGLAAPAGLATGAIAAIQMPRGAHYVSDVIAGAAIGWVAEALVSAVFDRVEPPLVKAAAGAMSKAAPA